MAQVRLLATGGTIASRTGDDGRTAQLSAADLLGQLPGLPQDVSVEPVDVATVLSAALQLTDLQDLGSRVRQALDDGCDGVVITHGTDALEETAFYLELCHRNERPVILTGAQRPADSPAPDGPQNLAAAITAAAAPAARACGVLVVFDGLGWPARGVQKLDTLTSAAFGAPGRGPVLRIAGGAVHLLARPERPSVPELDPDRELPRVDVIPLYLGADDVMLRAAVSAGAAGLVLAGFGAGNATPAVARAVHEVLADGVTVLICSRVPAGPVEALYDGSGGADLRRAGALFGGDLSPWQGRLLLAAALASGTSPASALEPWLT